MKEWLIASLTCVVLAGCTQSGPQSHTGGKPPNEYILPSDFFLNAQATRGSEGQIFVSGATNLPDGMKVSIEIDPGKKNSSSATLFVRAGKLLSDGLWTVVPNPNFRLYMNSFPDAASLKTRREPFPANSHRVRFLAYFNGAWQSPEVLALIGEGGKRLHGQLFKYKDPDVVDSDMILNTTLSIGFPPISAEVRAINAVKHAVLTVPGYGRSATDVEANLNYDMNPKIGLSRAKGWSARAVGRSTYEVAFDFINGNLGEQEAVWSVDLGTGVVKYVNKNAKNFSWTPSY